jgi:hypothetical protein
MSDEVPPPGLTAQDIHRRQVWELFMGLGLGLKVGLIHPAQGPTIWCRGVGPNGPTEYYGSPEAMERLIEQGLAIKSDRFPAHGIEEFYELTDKGRMLYESYSALTDAGQEDATNPNLK